MVGIDNIHVIFLIESRLVKGAKDIIEQFERALCPDNESAKVTAWSELQEVESPDINEFDTWQVAEGLDDTVVLVINDQGTTTLAVAAVTHLALSGTEFPGVGNLDDVRVRVEGLEESYRLFGFFEGLDGGGDDEGDFFELFDAVSTCENEGGEGGCCEGGDYCEPALVSVYFDVPFAPGFGRGEHTASTAHVSERTLQEKKKKKRGECSQLLALRWRVSGVRT